MNYLSIDNLPRYKDKGYNQGKIDWSSSIGMEVEFQFVLSKTSARLFINQKVR